MGERDQHLIPRIVERAKADKLKIVGKDHNLVDIVHVKNAAYAHLLALDALIKGTAPGKALLYFKK